MTPPAHLAPALKALVRDVEATLGQVVREAEGEALFAAVEEVRRHMVAFREARGARAETRALEQVQQVLERLAPAERAALGRAYTLYLELVNVCENAYRTHRLRQRAAGAPPRPSTAAPARAHLTWVLTAHPTESRAPENIRLLRRAQALLVRALDAGELPDRSQLAPVLHLAWRLGTHPRHKPSVEDEARHIFSLLDDPALEALLHLARRGHRVRLRTWVGGDKDGHPGVGPAQTLASLQLSRERLLTFARARLLPHVAEDVALLAAPPLTRALGRFTRALDALEHVRPGDGGRITALGHALAILRARYAEAGGREHPRLGDVVRLLEQLPALVVPLELREERGRFTADSPIARMLEALAAVARGGRVNAYVRGCVVSMATSAADLHEALDLITRTLPATGAARGRGDRRRIPAIPVIPLFELPAVLPRAQEILEAALADPRFVTAAREHGGVEVMLGYSDTAKRMGVLASRLAIHDAMAALGRWAAGRGLPLVFFHGSGGSEGRGGGTPEEQAATWPADALGLVKTTLQGEMIERTFSSPEILTSQVEKVAVVQAAPPAFAPPSAFTRDLGRRSQAAYVAFVRDPGFLDLLERATPYPHLGALNIGSRPARRGTKRRAPAADALDSLRAIPWVLCWTQVRLLLPVWLGVGSAWRALRARPGGQAALRAALEVDPLLRAFVRLLGFALAKGEPRLWREYVRRLAPDAPPALLKRLEREREAALDLARRASPTGDLLPDRPWLRESIHYRAPMIHPLNLLQLGVLERAQSTPADQALFRETVTGIAAGMLTTG